MDIKGQKVTHKAFGTGVVTAQTESLVVINFDAGEKKFQYPTAFKQFLVCCDSALQESVIGEIEAAEQEKAALLAKQSFVTHEVVPIQKKKRTRVARPNIAFKCNYCEEVNLRFQSVSTEFAVKESSDTTLMLNSEHGVVPKTPLVSTTFAAILPEMN